MTSVAITEPGAFLSAKVCAALRHPLMRDLAEARRDQMSVSAEIVDAITLIDNVGAWYEARHASKVSDVSPGVSQLDTRRCEAEEYRQMTVSAAAEALRISPQATRKLLERGTLHGERGPRAWRVCAESVAARKDNTTCQH
jgi:hypothetical protein